MHQPNMAGIAVGKASHTTPISVLPCVLVDSPLWSLARTPQRRLKLASPKVLDVLMTSRDKSEHKRSLINVLHIPNKQKIIIMETVETQRR